MSSKPLWVRAYGKRSGRSRLTNGLRCITKPGRKLTAAERAAVEQRLRSEGILPRTTSNEVHHD